MDDLGGKPTILRKHPCRLRDMMVGSEIPVKGQAVGMVWKFCKLYVTFYQEFNWWGAFARFLKFHQLDEMSGQWKTSKFSLLLHLFKPCDGLDTFCFYTEWSVTWALVVVSDFVRGFTDFTKRLAVEILRRRPPKQDLPHRHAPLCAAAYLRRPV